MRRALGGSRGQRRDFVGSTPGAEGSRARQGLLHAGMPASRASSPWHPRFLLAALPAAGARRWQRGARTSPLARAKERAGGGGAEGAAGIARRRSACVPRATPDRWLLVCERRRLGLARRRQAAAACKSPLGACAPAEGASVRERAAGGVAAVRGGACAPVLGLGGAGWRRLCGSCGPRGWCREFFFEMDAWGLLMRMHAGVNACVSAARALTERMLPPPAGRMPTCGRCWTW